MGCAVSSPEQKHAPTAHVHAKPNPANAAKASTPVSAAGSSASSSTPKAAAGAASPKAAGSATPKAAGGASTPTAAHAGNLPSSPVSTPLSPAQDAAKKHEATPYSMPTKFSDLYS